VENRIEGRLYLKGEGFPQFGTNGYLPNFPKKGLEGPLKKESVPSLNWIGGLKGLSLSLLPNFLGWVGIWVFIPF